MESLLCYQHEHHVQTLSARIALGQFRKFQTQENTSA